MMTLRALALFYGGLVRRKNVLSTIMHSMAAIPIVTVIGTQPATFYPAEAYHQDFFERNPYQGYCLAVAAPKVAKFRQTFARLVRG